MFWIFPLEGRGRGVTEMSSILADQQRPRIWAQIRGKGGGGAGFKQIFGGLTLQYFELKAEAFPGE